MRSWLVFGLFAVLVAVLAIGLTRDPTRVSSPLIDQPLPALQAELLEVPGQPFEMAQMRGQWSLLNVWASWCVTCLEEHSLLMRLSSQIALYGVNHRDLRDDAQTWLRRYGNPYRASLFDEQGNVGIDLGVYKVPETFLVDTQGIIRYKHIGALTEEVWRFEMLPRIRGEVSS